MKIVKSHLSLGSRISASVWYVTIPTVSGPCMYADMHEGIEKGNAKSTSET